MLKNGLWVGCSQTAFFVGRPRGLILGERGFGECFEPTESAGVGYLGKHEPVQVGDGPRQNPVAVRSHSSKPSRLHAYVPEP